MTLIVELPPELESKSQEIAQAEGPDMPTFVREATEARMRQYDPSRQLTDAELHARINRGFPETFWDRDRRLIARRRAESLTRKERLELIGLSDELEAWRVERLQYLTRLAQLRQTTVDALTQQLGLYPATVE